MLIFQNRFKFQVTISQNEKYIATGSKDTAKIWDIETGMLKQNLVGHSHWVTSTEFSPNGIQPTFMRFKYARSTGRPISYEAISQTRAIF